VALDIDPSPFDNSGTKKEGVSWTYLKFDGYNPWFAYLGNEGYLVHCQLREGSQHCQDGMPQFLDETIAYARRITSAKLLVPVVLAEQSVAWRVGQPVRAVHGPGTPGPRIVGARNDARVREPLLETPEILCPCGDRNAALTSLEASVRCGPSPPRQGDDVHPHKKLPTSFNRPLSTSNVTDSGRDYPSKCAKPELILLRRVMAIYSERDLSDRCPCSALGLADRAAPLSLHTRSFVPFLHVTGFVYDADRIRPGVLTDDQLLQAA
jgi:hypothetical protein